MKTDLFQSCGHCWVFQICWHIEWSIKVERSWMLKDMLLLLSRFSHVRLCVTPGTVAHQAPPSLGFSRQEYWNELPFPSPMHESEKWKVKVKLPSHVGIHRRTVQKKELHDPYNHDGVITHLEPDILECEVKWALESITTSKASGGDGIPVELFQILKDDAVKVLHSICQQIWKTQKWPQDWKRSVFIPIPKKGNTKECSNYHTIVLISHTSKVMLKILQVRLQQYLNQELPAVQAAFRKRRGARYQIVNICWSIEKAREFQKNIYFCSIDDTKAFDCMDHNKLWKTL